MNNKINDIHNVCLDIYKEYKRICDKYNLRYYAIGGTCIGAIRHQGFIPWDDDMDLAMPFFDFIKFKHVAKKELNKKYSIYSPTNHKHFCGLFLKIENVNTTFIEEEILPYKDAYRGISIDVMPIFGMPKSKNKQKNMMKLNDLFIMLNIKLRMPLSSQPTAKSKLLWIFLAPLKLLLPYNYWVKIIIKKYSKYKFDNSDKILFAWRRMPSKRNLTNYKSMFDYKDFSGYIEKKFEDTYIRVPVGYDNYLKEDFGDYMTLPPKGDRNPQHKCAILDLNKSYKYYL